MADPARIDARAPRFVASITAVLLLVDVFLALVTGGGAGANVAERIADPAFLLLLAIAILFAWSVIWPRTAPWGALYRTVVQPRLKPPTEFEDPRPPRFAQGVGLFVTGVGLVLQLAGVPWGLTIAAAAAFVAAFLNAAFGLCLGCQLYLLLQRAGIVGRSGTAV
ncbi:MAG: DUF4395 domain-containing protein [Microbacterium sp.]|uniref:DUF4395 domain-containing protein n=1 Tax=Microbacterium sp. TaxID=51671 RepID=UPI0039E63707